MAKILKGLYNVYNILDDDWSDPRSTDWFPVSSPLCSFGFVFFYVRFVTDWGPRLMKGRKPFELNNAIKAFNIVQIVCNLLLFCWGVCFMWRGHYNWWCQSLDFSNSAESLEVLNITRCYFLLKISDLLDTVFFVLRKNYRQITVLHLYHHTGILIGSWMTVKYLPGGHFFFMGFVNTGIHAIMYSYYLLTSIDSKYKTSIWWKKHITQLQMIQFLINIIHLSLPLVWIKCDYPSWPLYIMSLQNVIVLVLFANFYKKQYLRKPYKTT